MRVRVYSFRWHRTTISYCIIIIFRSPVGWISGWCERGGGRGENLRRTRSFATVHETIPSTYRVLQRIHDDDRLALSPRPQRYNNNNNNTYELYSSSDPFHPSLPPSHHYVAFSRRRRVINRCCYSLSSAPTHDVRRSRYQLRE